MNFPTSYAAAVAVPLPDDDVIRPVIEDYYGSTYQPDTTLNVVKMFAGTGAHFPGVIDLVNAIFGPEGINPKHRRRLGLYFALPGVRRVGRRQDADRRNAHRTSSHIW